MSLHHAFLFSSESQLADNITDYSSDSSEVRYLQFNQLQIANVRDVTDQAYRSPANRFTELVLCIICEQVTYEAQNALLKLLETPPVTTRFLFVVTQWEALLPTVRSRFQCVSSVNVDTVVELPHILQLDIASAMTEVENRLKQKDTIWVTETKVQCLRWLGQLAIPTVSASTKTTLYQSVALLATRGASNKWLLENIIICWHSRSRRTA